jgi:hypothetical protein
MALARARAVQLSFWRGVRLVLALVALLGVRSAHAADKREPQDYGAKKPSQLGPALLWVPRVLLFPPWVVSEYVVRQPVGLLVRTAERNQWPEAVVNFFTFGDRGQVTLFPSALFDFGLKPSVGFNLKWKYFLAEPNTLTVHAGTWGPDWLAVSASDSYQLNERHALSLEGALINRKDLPFYGMGPRSPSTPRYRYQALKTDLALAYRADLWRSSSITARAGMRSLSFGDGTCCRSRSVYDAVATGDLPLPPGLGDGYVAAYQGASAALDSRRARPDSGTGVRVEARGELVEAPAHDRAPRRAWASYGGTVGVAVDTWRGRVVGLSVAADFADPLLGTIPFTDQVSLGGNRPLRGFLQGRLIDRSSVVASIQYTWPVWVYLDGLIQTDVGNVFGPHLAGFDWALLRLSSGIGVRSTGDPASGLEVLVAAGTDPFESGFHVSSFRLVLGSHHGF